MTSPSHRDLAGHQTEPELDQSAEQAPPYAELPWFTHKDAVEFGTKYPKVPENNNVRTQFNETVDWLYNTGQTWLANDFANNMQTKHGQTPIGVIDALTNVRLSQNFISDDKGRRTEITKKFLSKGTKFEQKIREAFLISYANRNPLIEQHFVDSVRRKAAYWGKASGRGYENLDESILESLYIKERPALMEKLRKGNLGYSDRPWGQRGSMEPDYVRYKKEVAKRTEERAGKVIAAADITGLDFWNAIAYGAGWVTRNPEIMEKHRTIIEKGMDLKSALVAEQLPNVEVVKGVDSNGKRSLVVGDRYFHIDANGERVELDPSLITGINAIRDELILGMALGGLGWKYGAAAGGNIGQALGTPFGPPGMAIGRGLGTVGGGVLGAYGAGGVGVGLGAMSDAERAAAILAFDLDWDDRGREFMNGLLAELALAPTAAAALKGVKIGGAATANVVGSAAVKTKRGMQEFFKFFAQGNIGGAVELALRRAGKTRDEVLAIIEHAESLQSQHDTIEKWWGLTNRELTEDEKIVRYITQGLPGGEDPIWQTGKSTSEVRKEVSDRAADVKKAGQQLAEKGDPTKPRLGRQLQDEYEAIELATTQRYTDIKEIGGAAIDETEFRFALESTAISPMAGPYRFEIGHPRQADAIKNMLLNLSDTTHVRTFTGLLDLRDTVYDALRSMKNPDSRTKQMVAASLAKMDSTIKAAAMEHLGKEAGTDYMKALINSRKAFHNMRALRDQVLYKTIANARTDGDIIQSLTRYGVGTIDNTYREMLDLLPPKLRIRTEGAILSNLIEKNSFGDDHGLQALNFPKLLDDIQSFTYKTVHSNGKVTEHKILKSKPAEVFEASIKEFAEIFRNDVGMMRLRSGDSTSNTHFLTASPWQRLRFAIATHVFDNVRRFLPTQHGKAVALTKAAGNVLNSPLNAEFGRDFLKLVPEKERASYAEHLSKLREAEVANIKKKARHHQSSRVTQPLYISTTTGAAKRRNGPLGKGYYMSETAKTRTANSQVIKVDIEPGELATQADIDFAMGRKIDAKKIAELKSLPGRLKKAGFKGIKIGNRIILFDEPGK